MCSKEQEKNLKKKVSETDKCEQIKVQQRNQNYF